MQLGPYEVIAPIGAGGMGEVYRARDTRLGREVAIKLLPPSFTPDCERLRRFELEARTIATLSHPNVVALFDTGQFDGTPYLVSELLQGETLRDKLQAGPLSSRRTIEYTSQIADGLAAAHDRGIIHRDCKPENIFINKDGRVKILDFGLAKLAPVATPLVATAAGVTETSPGLVVGTAGYMSPEQVRGGEVDARTDIFSLGAILYEMLSGRRAFKGETSVETMTSILKDDPPELDSATLHVSPGLERIVRRCLEKEPSQRFHSAHDVKFAMEALSDSSATGTQLRLRPRSRWLWVGVAAAVVVLASLLALWFARASETAARPMHFAIPVVGEVSYLAISADGTMLAYVSPDEASGKNLLFVQPVGGEKASALGGTEGAIYPFWSPDDEFVAYFAAGKLMKIRATGGAPQPVASASQSPRGGSWGRKGVILYAPDAGGFLWRVNADGSGAAPLTDKIFAAGEVTHRWPLFLPDGEHFLFLGGDFSKTGDWFYLSSLSSKEKQRLILAESNVGFSQPGYLYYADSAGRLFSRAFDANTGTLSGEPRLLLAQVGYQPSLLGAAFAVAENGTIVSDPTAAGSRSVLTWYDRQGKKLATVGQSGILANPALSPDGRRVAADLADLQAANVSVWIHDLGGGAVTRFTFGRIEDVVAVWSRDGKQVSFRSQGNGLVVKPATGLEPERVLVPASADDHLPNSWSPDERSLVCTVQYARGGSKLEVTNVGDGNRTQLPTGNANASQGQISPDGKWLAYASDESGTWEIYLTTFPAIHGKWQVSQGGGTEPRWRGDGKELFYLSAKGMMTAVPIAAGASFSSGPPQPLFPVHARPPISSSDLYSYDVTKDGRRFIVNQYQKPASAPPLDIVLNATR